MSPDGSVPPGAPVSPGAQALQALQALQAPDPAAFVATTTPVAPSAWTASIAAAAADAGVLVEGRERALAGLGVAAALHLDRGLEDEASLLAVRDWLAALGPRVAALGAFAFDRAAPATLLVPAVTWSRDKDGQTWRVEVRRRDDPATSAVPSAPDPLATSGTGAAPDARATTLDPSAVAEVPPPDGYAGAVARAVGDIRAGTLSKVVLGRMVDMRLPFPAVPSLLLEALGDPGGLFSAFSVPTGTGRLVGASPELLVLRRGTSVSSHPLAGTAALTGDEDDAQVRRLFDSAKDREEHRLVVDAVVAALEQRCSALTVPPEPTVVRLGSDARLGTLVRGALTHAGARGTTALALLAMLHPTPAVAGVPRAAALERIASLEPAPRGYWAGAVGWTDGAGDGEWILAIRSVELEGRRALVRAGAGIVAASDPGHELAETTLKLRPVLDALWPGASALL